VYTSLAGTVIPDANGSWSVTGRVGDAIAPGEQSATAFCGSQSDAALVFNYLYVTVRVATYRELQVAPRSTVHRGATLTITPNAPCPNDGPITRVDVTLQTPSAGEYNADPITPDYYAVFAPDAKGNWSGHLRVTPDTPPGSYVLNAICGVSRAQTAWYTYAPITVT
jgi:hypothetical protein